MAANFVADPAGTHKGKSPTPREAARHCVLEGERIRFLIERDGPEEARSWIKRTLVIYRRAVLDPGHFASSPGYRRDFLLSCADFRRWLAERA